LFVTFHSISPAQPVSIAHGDLVESELALSSSWLLVSNPVDR